MDVETPPLPGDDRGGTKDCPWTVMVQQGQRINVSLIALLPYRQEAELPQGDSASAMYVFLDSLTDRAIL